MNFKLVSSFTPKGDQPQAIDGLVAGIKNGAKDQVLLGVTGSGKTFTMAQVIAKLNRPTLIISHNKTLAAQLYQEFHSFFPQNAVSYFVSYYDYYQPEAYLPSTDTYIEKETEINEEIDKLRLAATTNLLTRPDTIIIASVSCIYNIGSPKEYGNYVVDVRVGVPVSRDSILKRLVELHYERMQWGFDRGTFRVRGENIDVFLAYEDVALRITLDGNKIKELQKIDPLTGKVIDTLERYLIYPAKHYMTDPNKNKQVFDVIRGDLDKRVKELKRLGKDLEAYRIGKRVNYDLEMMLEMGYVNGIENYSRYFDGRSPGDPPYSLLEYYNEPYKNDWLLFIDESHITIPQIRGMYAGDRSRKQTLIDFGFRLPAALDNRPLNFEEFLRRIPQTMYVSATPSEWELSRSGEEAQRLGSKKYPNGVVELLVRPTGITDPKIIIKPTANQLVDLIEEIIKRKQNKQRTLVTTLTKKLAEDISIFLNEKKYRELPQFKEIKDEDCPLVTYLHSDVETLERSDILDNLRNGTFDVLIGINLLREGLDLPEVSLVAILDADKEGFLRSDTSLIQTMGRAARHIEGTVIMYADKVTGSMERAIAEIDRRRNIQFAYNKKHNITPVSIHKPIRDKLIEADSEDIKDKTLRSLDTKKMIEYKNLLDIDSNQLTPRDLTKLIKRLEHEMKQAASELNFELAMEIRDRIRKLKQE
jgi:excinuclease ABC subunit B